MLAAVLLTTVFWLPLWRGGGLVGGDTYAYSLPQKAYYAEQLRSGVIPLWNNRIGFGYPFVAESQAGVFYPLNLVLYGALSAVLDLNAAFSAGIIVHYVLAFVFAWMYARRIGLTLAGAGLAALVYTYGWFPPRVCLEWSIVGGAWLPLALWCAESFLQTQLWRYAFLLTATLAVQMFAGHFTLAFITQLTLAGYVPLRLWFSRRDLPPATGNTRGAACAGLVLAIAAAFLVAAVQLLPTWELKRLSQRAGVTDEHDPGYGSIPVVYLSQIALPWHWYVDASSFQAAVTPGGSRTNRVEAHLYFGLIPLAFIVWGVWLLWRNGDRRLAVWMILGLAALAYTPGWLLPVTIHLPGFSFFEGPGRYGVVTTLAAGLLAGSGLADVWRYSRPAVRWLLAIAVFGGTVADLFIVSRLVTDAYLVKQPPLAYLDESPLRLKLQSLPQPVRIFSEGKNLPSLLGVATLPTYLGLGPAQYFDPELTLPGSWSVAAPPSREQLDWLRRAGVTHYLRFGPIDSRTWSARLIWEGSDQFLNSALGRREEFLYLYELKGSRGRAAFRDAESGQTASVTDYRANSVAIEADSPSRGRLILTDLAFPGWKVDVDGQRADSLMIEGLFRGVDLPPGKHTVIWNYRPATLYWGTGISAVSVLILMGVAHFRYWRPFKK